MEKAVVLEYMRVHSLLGFEWIAQYVADVTNAFLLEALNPEGAPSAVESLIAEMARLQQRQQLMTAEMVRRLLFEYLTGGLLVFDIPEAAEQMAVPKNEQPLRQNELERRRHEAELQKYSAEIQRYHLRRPNIQFAGRLVSAAEQLEGWFHWVPAGPAERTSFASETTNGGEADHFAYWLNRGRNEPDHTANMNCWEAVFFAAYKAGLVSIHRLRLIHGKATMAARATTAFAYFDSLTDSLGYQNSFKYAPSIGLCPNPGDIVFFERDHHVALCVETGASTIVMSHWKHPRDGFRRYDIDEFTVNMNVRFGQISF